MNADEMANESAILSFNASPLSLFLDYRNIQFGLSLATPTPNQLSFNGEKDYLATRLDQ